MKSWKRRHGGAHPQAAGTRKYGEMIDNDERQHSVEFKHFRRPKFSHAHWCCILSTAGHSYGAVGRTAAIAVTSRVVKRDWRISKNFGVEIQSKSGYILLYNVPVVFYSHYSPIVAQVISGTSLIGWYGCVPYSNQHRPSQTGDWKDTHDTFL